MLKEKNNTYSGNIRERRNFLFTEIIIDIMVIEIRSVVKI